jgi:hypothetical protein
MLAASMPYPSRAMPEEQNDQPKRKDLFAALEKMAEDDEKADSAPAPPAPPAPAPGKTESAPAPPAAPADED